MLASPSSSCMSLVSVSSSSVSSGWVGGGLGSSVPFESIYTDKVMLMLECVMCACECVFVSNCAPCSVSQGSAGVAVGPPAAAGPGGTGAKVRSGSEPAADGEAAC